MQGKYNSSLMGNARAEQASAHTTSAFSGVLCWLLCNQLGTGKEREPMSTFAHLSWCLVRWVTTARTMSCVEERRMSRRARWMYFSLVLLVLVSTAFGQAVLPQPEPPFKGQIGRTVKESTPDFPKGVEAPQGAPNVLLILTDDVGFGASSP